MPHLAPRFVVLTVACAMMAVLATAGPAAMAQQAPPATDIYLAAIDLGVAPPTTGTPRNLTDRDGYDNQPAFEPDGQGLLYTSQREGQTDIQRIDLATFAASSVTATPESEYSALPIPGQEAVAVVRVEADGTQRLWSFPRSGDAPQVLFAELAPVGYHAWNPDGLVAMFVLGEPATLWLGDPHEPGAVREIASDIGRSLQAIPGSSDFSFLQRVEGFAELRRLRPDGSSESLGSALAGSQDVAWTPDGRALMAFESALYLRSDDGTWSVLAEFADDGVHGISRLAISPDGRWLAFVAGR